MTRSEERAEAVRQAGARAAVVDVFDADALRAAMAEARAEVVVHELTALPDRTGLSQKDLYETTNRLRTEGTRNLLDAALAAGARPLRVPEHRVRLPAEGALKTEDDPLLDDAPGAFASGVRALHEMEEIVLGRRGHRGRRAPLRLLLRPRHLLRASDGTTTADIRRRRMPIVGQGHRHLLVHPRGRRGRRHRRRGRARRARRLQRRGRRAAPMREWLPAFAEAAGAKPPFRVPGLAREARGREEAATFALELRGASNEKAKRELGWSRPTPAGAPASASRSDDLDLGHADARGRRDLRELMRSGATPDPERIIGDTFKGLNRGLLPKLTGERFHKVFDERTRSRSATTSSSGAGGRWSSAGSASARPGRRCASTTTTAGTGAHLPLRGLKDDVVLPNPATTTCCWAGHGCSACGWPTSCWSASASSRSSRRAAGRSSRRRSAGCRRSGASAT